MTTEDDRQPPVTPIERERPPAARFIDSSGPLAELPGQFAGARWLAVDTEGDGFHRYRCRLCVIQVSDGERAVIIDPLAFDDLGALTPLLSGPGAPTRVLHDVSFDAKMLDERGVPLDGVFDTAIAARFLSEPSTGLGAMLERYVGVKLDKGDQRADWGERPITESRLEYLVDDVWYLPRLADHLYARAAEADILEELEEETRYAIARALEPETPREPWTRLKGVKDIGPKGLALAKALTDAREAEAARRDVPPFRVASNGAVLEAIDRRATTTKELRRVRGLRGLDSATLTEALRRAAEDGPPPRPEKPTPPPPAERAAQKEREKRLNAWRAAEATRRGVDVQVVLPGHCMRELVSRGLTEEALESVAGFGDKRRRLYGEALLALGTAAPEAEPE